MMTRAPVASVRPSGLNASVSTTSRCPAERVQDGGVADVPHVRRAVGDAVGKEPAVGAEGDALDRPTVVVDREDATIDSVHQVPPFPPAQLGRGQGEPSLGIRDLVRPQRRSGRAAMFAT